MKNAIFNTLLTERVAVNTGTWIDKTEYFRAKFEDIVPTAKLQANVLAIASLDDIASDVFSFADMEILDANLAMIPRGLPHMDYSQAAQARTCYLNFTITVSPHLIVPGVIDFDPATFPNPTSKMVVVYVRALMQNGALSAGLSKHLLDNTPKLAFFIYTQAHTEFDILIKFRSDAAPDQADWKEPKLWCNV